MPILDIALGCPQTGRQKALFQKAQCGRWTPSSHRKYHQIISNKFKYFPSKQLSSIDALSIPGWRLIQLIMSTDRVKSLTMSKFQKIWSQGGYLLIYAINTSMEYDVAFLVPRCFEFFFKFCVSSGAFQKSEGYQNLFIDFKNIYVWCRVMSNSLSTCSQMKIAGN